MKVGDMVRATEGQIVGMLGVLTKVVPLNPGSPSCGVGNVADVFWNNGEHQSFVSTKYLEVVSK